MTDRIARVMLFQLKAALKADHPNLMVYVDESDVQSWFFLVTNLPDPYVGGEYIFQLEAPNDFPTRPPKFQFLTPNGVFKPGAVVLIDKKGNLRVYPEPDKIEEWVEKLLAE